MTENQKTEPKKVARERSAAYPAIPLEQAVDFGIKLQTAFGKSPFSRENAVKEMGYKTVTGTSGMRVAALVHYGLLNREGNAYRNSELSIRVAHPVDDDDSKAAIKSAAFAPKLYKSLIKEFSGRAVPTALNSILIQHHKINRKVADGVADVFRKTIEYAGIYPNGIVSSDLPESDEESVENSDGVQSQTGERSQPHRPAQSSVGGRNDGSHFAPGLTSVELPSGIILSYPKNLAYAFTIGTFGKDIAALEEAIQKELKKNETGNQSKDDTLTTE